MSFGERSRASDTDIRQLGEAAGGDAPGGRGIGILAEAVPAPLGGDRASSTGTTRPPRHLERDEAGSEVSLVYAPDATATPSMPEALIAHCERRGDRFAVIDAPGEGDPLPRRAWDSAYAASTTRGSSQRTRRAEEPASCRPAVMCSASTRAPTPRAGSGRPGQRGGRAAPRTWSTRSPTGRRQDLLNPRGVNVHPPLRRAAASACGARARLQRPDVEVRERPPAVHLPRGVDRQRHAVGGVRAERRADCGRACAQTVAQVPDARQWRNGALLGRDGGARRSSSSATATTMTQDDIDNGRLICVDRRRARASRPSS